MPISADQLAALIERHAVPLRIWAGRLSDDGDDVAQEAFCRLAALNHTPERPVAWLYRVARNLAANQRLASRRRREREARRAAAEPYEPDAAANVMASEALAALRDIDAPLREVLVAKIWGELSLDEIGQLCGISAATASRRYHAALEELRKRLDEPCMNKKP